MADTRLTPDIELDGLAPEEAFAALGNEIRLDIIRVLWRAGAHHVYEEVDETASTVPYSALQDRVDVPDNGQFNYHLSQLVPHFVRQTEAGYRLSGAGKKIARTVVAVAGEREPSVGDELEMDCPLCGAPVTATYDDQWLRFTCTECDGLFGDAAPAGTVFNATIPPAGMAGKTAQTGLSTGLYRCILDLSYLMAGICRECAGPITGSLVVVDDDGSRERATGDTADARATGDTADEWSTGDTDDERTTGDTADGPDFDVWGDLRCETCRFAKRLPIEFCVVGLAPVRWFLDEQGVSVTPPTMEEVVPLLATRVETTVEDDPRRVTVGIDGEDGNLAVTLDSDLSVLEIED